MNSKTAKLLNRAARCGAVVALSKEKSISASKNPARYHEVLGLVRKRMIKNFKAGWKALPWNQRAGKRRRYRHLIMQVEHALNKGAMKC